MKRKKLYMAILLFAGILTSCKVGKSYVRPDLHLPDSLAQHQDSVSFGDQDWKDIYADSTLRSLIDRALEHNKDMLIAAARVKEMAAQKRISTAALKPNFLFHGNSTFGEICVGHVRPVLLNICNL